MGKLEKSVATHGHSTSLTNKAAMQPVRRYVAHCYRSVGSMSCTAIDFPIAKGPDRIKAQRGALKAQTPRACFRLATEEFAQSRRASRRDGHRAPPRRNDCQAPPPAPLRPRANPLGSVRRMSKKPRPITRKPAAG
jgi:hypothetical protein